MTPAVVFDAFMAAARTGSRLYASQLMNAVLDVGVAR